MGMKRGRSLNAVKKNDHKRGAKRIGAGERIRIVGHVLKGEWSGEKGSENQQNCSGKLGTSSRGRGLS